MYAVYRIECTCLWQLFRNVSTNKHSLKIDPKILHNQPTFNNLRGVSKLLYPKLNLFLKGGIVPVQLHGGNN